ncbi:MAG: glutamate-5-semialdehyde dehydrogenase [Alphaproteobacteria bacterium]|nr:glutamate-5-semialdehyde dehydrogenase [Alphaproteobacteria bacterium]
MSELGRRARAAAETARLAEPPQKTDALLAAAEAIDQAKAAILEANAADQAAAMKAGAAAPLLDRLRLDEARLASIATAIRDVARLPDPVGEIIERRQRPNGLVIERVRTPIGVIAIIYESRPNVTADAAALCLKSGNAAILRSGSEAFRTSRAIHAAFVRGLKEAGLDADVAQLVPTTDRAAVGAILSGLDGAVDLIVPRGGKSLVERVQREARAPVLGHLEGLCHVYVDRSADLNKAVDIVVNSKMRRTGICGAAETLLIDRARLAELWPPIAAALRAAGCEIRGDEIIRSADPKVTPASEDDFHTEFLDAVISAKAVEGVNGAVRHIAEYGTHHTESIVAEDRAAAEEFLKRVDSAIVIHNASTQFADGGEFGLGAEIGIATGRLHARGPVGVNELTTYKNIVRGTGQTRP